MPRNYLQSVSLFAIVLFTVLLCATASMAQTSTSGAVDGYVYEAGTKTPISGAKVSARHKESGYVRAATTDLSGRYYIDMLRVGDYTITGEHPQYESIPSSMGPVQVRINWMQKVNPPPIELRRIGTAPATTTPVPRTVPPPGTAPGSAAVDSSDCWSTQPTPRVDRTLTGASCCLFRSRNPQLSTIWLSWHPALHHHLKQSEGWLDRASGPASGRRVSFRQRAAKPREQFHD